jgi:hypothetical protein
LYDDEDKRKDGVCGEVFIVEPGQLRTCMAEHKEEEQPDEGDVNHNLDEETAQKRPNGRIYLSLFWILAHNGFSTRLTPAEEGLIKERAHFFVKQFYLSADGKHGSRIHGRWWVR